MVWRSGHAGGHADDEIHAMFAARYLLNLIGQHVFENHELNANQLQPYLDGAAIAAEQPNSCPPRRLKLIACFGQTRFETHNRAAKASNTTSEAATLMSKPTT